MRDQSVTGGVLILALLIVALVISLYIYRMLPKSRKSNIIKQKLFASKRSTAIVITIGIFVGIALLVFGNIYLPQINMRHKLAREASAARMEEEASADLKHRNKISTLLRTGLFDETSPILENKIDTCAIIPQREGGSFLARNWRQACIFHYDTYIPTSYSKDELFALLVSQPGAEHTFGIPSINYHDERCGSFATRRNGQTTLVYYVKRSEVSKYCPSIESNEDNKSSEIFPSTGSKSYVHKDFKTKDIDPSKAYVSIQSREQYYLSDELGCNRFSFVLCKEPMDNAVPGFDK